MTEKVLSPVKYCHKSDANLFSITCELSQGATIQNDAHKNIKLNRGDELIAFDCQVKPKIARLQGWKYYLFHKMKHMLWLVHLMLYLMMRTLIMYGQMLRELCQMIINYESEQV